MTQSKFIILIILVFLLTLTTSIIQPALHKQVIIEDSDIGFSEEPVEQYKQPQTPTTQPLPDKPKNKEERKPSSSNVEKKQEEPLKTTPAKSTPQAPPKALPPVKPTAQKATPPAPKAQTPHILTEQEEIIVWNNWRSALQNQVMKDISLYAPLGTGFKFSFTIDKFGTISNLKVWSTNPSYTEQAIKVIKPTLLGYQGKPILNFPQGTQRVITNVNGGFRIAASTKYSRPSDYSDVEKVKN